MSKKRKEPRKKDRDWQKLLSRAFIVVILLACVIGFSLSFSFFSIFKTAEAGDYVTVYYTLYYEDDIPIISSDPYLVQDAYAEGNQILAYTSQMQLQAGSLQSDRFIPVDAYQPVLGNVEYALLNLEVDAMSSDVIGMHVNDVKQMDLEFGPSYSYNVTKETFDNSEGLNFSDIEVGMLLFRNIDLSDDTGSDNTTKVVRPSVVIAKTNDTATLRYGYSLAEIKVSDIT